MQFRPKCARKVQYSGRRSMLWNITCKLVISDGSCREKLSKFQRNRLENMTKFQLRPSQAFIWRNILSHNLQRRSKKRDFFPIVIFRNLIGSAVRIPQSKLIKSMAWVCRIYGTGFIKFLIGLSWSVWIIARWRRCNDVIKEENTNLQSLVHFDAWDRKSIIKLVAILNLNYQIHCWSEKARLSKLILNSYLSKGVSRKLKFNVPAKVSG